MIRDYNGYKVYDLPSASAAFQAGAMTPEEFFSFLYEQGFSKDSSGHFSRDSRSDFMKWIHEKFGPTLASLASTVVTLGLFDELAKSNNSNSGVTVDSAIGNDVIGTSANAGNTGQLVSNLLGDSQSSSTLSNIWNHLSGVGSSLLSGISQLGTGIIGQLASSTLNYENQKKLIDAQNAYNTPAAQMQRFAEAGLNPNLIYGLGSNGNQPASGAVAPVDFDTSQREARLAKMNIETQTKLANADAAQKMSAAKLNETQTGLVDEQRKSAMMQNQVWLENYQADLNLKLQEKDNLIAEQRRMLAEARGSEIKNQYSDRIYQLEVEKAQLEKEISQIQRNWQPYLNAGQIFGNVVGGFRDFGLGLGSILRGSRRSARSSN